MLVDSHCHLNFKDFEADLEAVIANAKLHGVGAMQTICTELSEFNEIHAIAQAHENIFCSVGVHPNESGKTDLCTLDDLTRRAAMPKVIGIGETGLDYHYETSDRETQKQSFLTHIAAARETGLPLIVHTRDADEDTVNILAQEMGKGAFKGLIHCFTSSFYLAEKVLELGFYISVSGIVTFKSADGIRQAIAKVPLERLLVETDAPYLAPVPHRGKRNEPAFTSHTNRFLAELKEISEAECARITTDNFYNLFSKAARASQGNAH